ncbi:MAG: GAF domain-containing protein [Chloroflexi bacterium]|nr:MAG: GAF domain-containing protein [Chloroflexota bacterium]
MSAITEPRAAKSFRAAGDRIVRQESALPSIVSRLLAAPVQARRHIASDGDEWSFRLAALATLGRYDGLAVLVDGAARSRYAYNIADDPTADAAIQSAIEETRQSGATVQAQTTIRLADERAASAAMVAPLVAADAISGVFIALRVGRSFAAADALIASGAGDLVALELARETAARRDEAHRRQAFALYELSRLALFGERPLETLQDVTALLTSAFDHDVAQIWLFEPDGALELCAATPGENLRFERMRPSEHDALAQAVRHQRLMRIGRGALRPWVPADTREVIVVPLADKTRSLGVLVLGRTRDRYDAAEEALAGVLGRYIGRLLSRAATIDRESAKRTDSGEAEREWVDEPQLTGS